MQPLVKQLPVAAAYVFAVLVYRRNEKLSSDCSAEIIPQHPEALGGDKVL